MTYVVRIEACRMATAPSADQTCSSLQSPSGRSQTKERLASHSRSGGNLSMSRQTDSCPTVAGYVSSPDKVRLQGVFDVVILRCPRGSGGAVLRRFGGSVRGEPAPECG